MMVKLLGLEKNYCLKMPEELRPLLAALYPASTLYPGLSKKLEVYATVGDTVTRTALEAGLAPKILVYDCAEKRVATSCPSIPKGYQVVEVENPRSCISWEAARALEEAVKSSRRTAVRVKGEEDLLALVLILEADQGSIIIYGQPGSGVVAVKASSFSKRLALRILEKFSKLKTR